MAKRLKTAVYPDEIYFARTINAGAEENVTTIISIFSIRDNVGDENRTAPAYTAIARGESHYSILIASAYGNDNLATWLYKRQSTYTGESVGGSFSGSPGSPTVCGCAHLDQVVFSEVIPFDITMAVEPAAGCVIADQPVFVEYSKIASVRNRNRPAPANSPISREVD